MTQLVMKGMAVGVEALTQKPQAKKDPEREGTSGI